MKRFLKIVYYWFFRRKKTYSQIGEDCIAEFYLPQKDNGVYIDVGANDPFYISNTYLFYRKGWSGICIEPDPLKSKIFKMMRHRDIVVNAGVGMSVETLNFYLFDPDTLSTFSSEEAEKYKKQGYRQTGVLKIPTMPLKEILEKNLNGREIDLLSIDTEGYDVQVLQSNDWVKYRPKMVILEVVEHDRVFGTAQKFDFDKFMIDRGYIKFASTHLNNIYMEKRYAGEKGVI